MNFAKLISKIDEDKRKGVIGRSTAILVSLSSVFGYRETSEVKRAILKNISIILYFYPLTTHQQSILDDLEITTHAKFGILSRIVIKAAKEVKIPAIYINDYVQAKSSWKAISNLSMDSRLKSKQILQYKTYQLTEAICEKLIDIEN
jgi:KaiC/GvpD/RAD55 family RecA-like ATPase